MNSRIIHIDNLQAFFNRHHDIADNLIYFANYDTLVKILVSFRVEIDAIIPPLFWCYGYQFRALPELQDGEILIIGK